MVTGFSVHPGAAEARRRGRGRLPVLRYALAHHYIFGEHKPGRTDIWANFQRALPSLPEAAPIAVSAPGRNARAPAVGFEEAGVDQVAFIQQSGNNSHQHICEALDLLLAT